MKRVFIIFMLLICGSVHAENVVQQPAKTVQTVQTGQTVQTVQRNPETTPQNINFENCTKIYSVNQEKLFYLTLASITANRFTIDEIQTTNGYIIFTANRYKYLATIGKVDNSNSILKITPCNNIYNFPIGIIHNTFKYIDLKMTTGNS